MTSLLAVTSKDIMNSGLNGLQIGACAVAAYTVAWAANQTARTLFPNFKLYFPSFRGLNALPFLAGEAAGLFFSSYLPSTSRLTGRVTGQLLAGEVAAWAGIRMLGTRVGRSIPNLLRLSVELLLAGTLGGFYGKERAIILFAAMGAVRGADS